MTLTQSVVLSFIQGVTEFLPISSSGHLHLFQHFLGLSTSLAFDIFFNTATFLAVLFYFRSQVPFFFKNIKYIIIGSLPAVIVGVFLKDQIELIFSSIKTLPYEFLFTAILLLSTHFFKIKNNTLSNSKAFIIGLFQALAIIPAVSRSGSTIFAGLLFGLSPLNAFNFSFCLFIPASLGALILDFKDILNLPNFGINYIIAFILTSIVGYFSLTILQKTLISRKFWFFGIYLLILSIVLFFVI